MKFKQSGLKLALSDPIVLSTNPYWLLVKAASGEAVWLTDVHDGSVLILETQSRPGLLSLKSAISGAKVLYALYSRTAVHQDSPPVAISIGDNTIEPTVNGNQTDGRRGATKYDLTASLNSYLLDNPGTDVVSVPITFASAIQGFVTVYPPQINFDQGENPS